MGEGTDPCISLRCVLPTDGIKAPVFFDGQYSDGDGGRVYNGDIGRCPSRGNVHSRYIAVYTYPRSGRGHSRERGTILQRWSCWKHYMPCVTLLLTLGMFADDPRSIRVRERVAPSSLALLPSFCRPANTTRNLRRSQREGSTISSSDISTRKLDHGR